MDNKEIKLQRLKDFEGVQLTENTYNAVIGLTLLWGLLIDFLLARFLTPYILRIDSRIILVGYLVISIACIALVFKARNVTFSFLGFTGLAFSMGLLLTYYLTFYNGKTIYSAFLATGIVVVSMMIVSLLFPAFFLGLGRVLGIALIVSIIVELIGRLLFRLPLDIMDYAVVVIFSGYIGFDWARAQAYPKTLKNAVASAADIYVDIINIFIRLLRIMGKNNK